MKLTFADITNSYIYVLFGFFAHLYIIYPSSILFSLDLGIERELLLTYFSIISIILLLISLALKWTWPIRIEEALIVLFIWILVRNLISKECFSCEWPDFNLFYSILCVVVMITSFLMNARHPKVSLFFTLISIVLMLITSLIPVACNQLTVEHANMNLLKFTLYSIVWFLNRRMRLSEYILSLNYLKSIRILYSYEDSQKKHLLCGVKHGKKKKTRKKIAHECDDIACFFMEGDEDCLIPRPLFENLDDLSRVILKQNKACGNISQEKLRNFAWQSHNLIKIHEIHCNYNAKRWFGNFFSWKYRFYDLYILNLFDLAKTLWILNVCSIFLFFVLLEYFLLSYYISWNIEELQCLLKRVKVMSHIRAIDINADLWQ